MVGSVSATRAGALRFSRCLTSSCLEEPCADDPPYRARRLLTIAAGTAPPTCVVSVSSGRGCPKGEVKLDPPLKDHHTATWATARQ